MSHATLTLIDFQASSVAAARRVADYAAKHDLSEPNANRDFVVLVKEVETVVDTAFRCATFMARKSDAVAEVATIWHEMEQVCDGALDTLRKATAANGEPIPLACCDRILDLRLAATERAELHTA